MNRILNAVILASLLIVTLSTCRIRITPLTPPADPTKVEVVCKAPLITKNILGTWTAGIRKTESGDTVAKSAPVTTAIFTKVGRLTFDSNNRVSDPDSILPNHSDLDNFGPLVYFSYEVKTDTIRNGAYSNMGELFWIWQYYRKSRNVIDRGTGYYHKVITNECKRIQLRGDALEIVLVRQ